MNRRIPASLFFFALVVCTTSTGCLSIADAFVEGLNQGASDGSGPAGTGDCHDAVKVCEDMVNAACTRFAECGLVASVESCTKDLESGSLPCAQADAADDFTQCDADMAVASCDDLAAQKQPASCTAPKIHFTNTVCQ
jgi:hypothetical protein